MIATRFRTVASVALVAFAALCCYLVSLRVAAERAQVAKLDRSLRAAHADIRDLTTELNTRGRLVQLERWNADVLALTAPRAGQYLAGDMQLASLATTPASGPAAEPAAASADSAAPPVAVAALEAPAAVARIAYRRAGDQPATRLVHQVSLTLDDVADASAVLRHAGLTPANLTTVATVAAQRLALLETAGKPARP